MRVLVVVDTDISIVARRNSFVIDSSITRRDSLIRSHVVVHNLDINPAERISDKSTVVPWVILRPRTRCAIVFAAGLDSSFVELVDELVVCACC